MHKFEIKVCRCYTKGRNNVRKFKSYCKNILPGKNGNILQLTPRSLMIECDKQTLFEILNELDKSSIPVRTVKKAI